MTITNTIAQLKGTVDNWIEEKILKHEENKHQGNGLEILQEEINQINKQLNTIESWTNEKINAGLLNGYSSSDFVKNEIEQYKWTANSSNVFDSDSDSKIIAIKQGNICLINLSNLSQKDSKLLQFNNQIELNNWNKIGITLSENFYPPFDIITHDSNGNKICISKRGEIKIWINKSLYESLKSSSDNRRKQDAYNNVYGTLVYPNVNYIDTKITNVSTSQLNNFYNGDCYKVKLTNIDNSALSNKYITISINGVSYLRTTDEYGSGTLDINLNNGEYKIVSKFTGDSIYKGSILEESIYVKKATPVFSTPNTTNNINKIKVLNNNGNPIQNLYVLLNINGNKIITTSSLSGEISIDLSKYSNTVNVTVTVPYNENQLRIIKTISTSWNYTIQ